MFHAYYNITFTTLLLAVLWCGGEFAKADEPVVSFQHDVLPILSDHCFICHGADSNARQADLRLDQREGIRTAFVPGSIELSDAWLRIISRDPTEQMPPRDHGRQLTKLQIETIRSWLLQGAKWQPHWAFTPVVKPSVPRKVLNQANGNAIDYFVRRQLDLIGMKPADPATRETFIRRLSFDLIGLPPTHAEVDAFLSDESPSATNRLITRLLNSPHYGEQMAVQWLDGARYADTNGYQNDFPRTMWPWRDWVIEAFNSNMPFDQFTIEQLAGDLLPNPRKSQVIATGFNRNHRTVTEGGSIDQEWHVENVIDRVETFGTVWLGMTLGCARCHDHKFDPISQKEFYQLFAFFNNGKEKGVYTEQLGNVGPQVIVSSKAQQQVQMKLKLVVQQTKKTLVETKMPTLCDCLTGNLSVELTLTLAANYVKAFRELESFTKSLPTVMVMKERKIPRKAYVLNRGLYNSPNLKEPLSPEVPSFFPPLPKQFKQNRLALARWLVGENHPLTARVQVNRLWQRFFGTGLVKSSEDFGLQGTRPSHPELLDWLAAEFVESGWNLQHIQRLIASSATYQQTSHASPEQFRLDPENRFLARGPRHRLSAEMLRNHALHVGQLLTPKIGGPSVMPYQPEGVWNDIAGAKPQKYKQSRGANLYRRSFYTYRRRTASHPAFSNFDAPTWEFCRVRRGQTNTPLQALALLNDPTYVEAARGLAVRMITGRESKVAERITFGFRLTTGRYPTDEELKRLTLSLEKHRQRFQKSPDDAKAWIDVGDSIPPAEINRIELAAYTSLASTLLNLDESVSKN